MKRARLLIPVWFFAAAAGAADVHGIWQIRGKGGELGAEGSAAPPFTQQGLAAFAANRAGIAARDRSVDRTLRCASPGAPRVMLFSHPFEVLQQPDSIVIVFQWNQLFRQIVMGDRRDQYVLPSAMGFSAGHWDGETLVVVTTDRSGNTFLDNSGLPHSDKLKLTERLKLTHGGRTLEDRLTIEDPETYTRPWHATLHFDRQPQRPLKEDVCVDRVAAGLPAVESPARGSSPAVVSRAAGGS